jgi:hypothetical protein
MPISIDILVAIVQSGGGFEIDAKEYAPADLLPFIGQMNTTAVLRIRNAGLWAPEELVSVARTAPPGVAEFVL